MSLKDKFYTDFQDAKKTHNKVRKGMIRRERSFDGQIINDLHVGCYAGRAGRRMQNALSDFENAVWITDLLSCTNETEASELFP